MFHLSSKKTPRGESILPILACQTDFPQKLSAHLLLSAQRMFGDPCHDSVLRGKKRHHIGPSLRPSATRIARQLDREAAQHTSGLAVGLKRKQEQGASSNLVSIVRGKIRQFAATWIVMFQ